MSGETERVICLEDVSKFYGEVLGVNHVELEMPPGITSLVGPNGSGKTTLMNLITGLLRPTRGSIRVLGIPTNRPEQLFRRVGYCTQYDSFPRGLSGYQFVYGFLRVHGFTRVEADTLAWRALERLGMVASADRRIASYSKGMRQRVKLAQAISHEPSVLILDEPLNGLDPMVREEVIAVFRDLAERGVHVILSSHILHEVDLLSDRVVILSQGYVVAEGEIRDVRREITAHPMQVLIRCDRPGVLASRVFEQDHVVEVKLDDDRRGVVVHTRDANSFYLLLNRIIVENNLHVEAVGPADEDVRAVYRYLVGEEGESA